MTAQAVGEPAVAVAPHAGHRRAVAVVAAVQAVVVAARAADQGQAGALGADDLSGSRRARSCGHAIRGDVGQLAHIRLRQAHGCIVKPSAPGLPRAPAQQVTGMPAAHGRKSSGNFSASRQTPAKTRRWRHGGTKQQVNAVKVTQACGRWHQRSVSQQSIAPGNLGWAPSAGVPKAARAPRNVLPHSATGQASLWMTSHRRATAGEEAKMAQVGMSGGFCHIVLRLVEDR